MVALGHWSFLPGHTLGKVHSIWALTGGELGLTPLLRISGEDSEVRGREPPSTTPTASSSLDVPMQRVGLR